MSIKLKGVKGIKGKNGKIKKLRGCWETRGK